MKLRIILLALLVYVAPGSLQAQDTETIYLSGTGFDHTVEWDFFCTAGMNSGQWTRIEVPSCWEQQGFGQYNYGHVPFERRLKEEGHYRHFFHVEESWKGKQVKLVFEGVMTDARVLINGKEAGPVHQGAFYPFSFDISSLVQYGKQNSLEVFVKKFSDNPSVNEAERKADYWIFGGIFRPVLLEIRPPAHITRVAVDAAADGLFTSDVFLEGIDQGHGIEVEIRAADGGYRCLDRPAADRRFDCPRPAILRQRSST
jgi:beta-galactosidase/beta-glucuronidase